MFFHEKDKDWTRNTHFPSSNLELPQMTLCKDNDTSYGNKKSLYKEGTSNVFQ